MGLMMLSDSYFRLVRRGDRFEALRRDALEKGLDAAASSYGWAAIRIRNQALATAQHDVELARKAT